MFMGNVHVSLRVYKAGKTLYIMYVVAIVYFHVILYKDAY